MTYQDAWKLDSGLRESMDLLIHASYFSQHADYQGGIPYLIFFIGEDENGDPVELRMPVGSDWSSADGGKTISHPTKRNIIKSSIYGHFIEHALAIEDAPQGMKLRDILFSRGTPMQAGIWQDLKIHLDLFEIKFGRSLDPVNRLMPTRFLGLITEGASPSQPAPVTQSPMQPQQATTAVAPLQQSPTPGTVAPTAASPADVVAQARASQATANGASPLMEQMIELARSSATHLEFQQKAFAIPEVLTDEELAIQVADEANGIWSLAHA
jgi:hypothetical protein